MDEDFSDGESSYEYSETMSDYEYDDNSDQEEEDDNHDNENISYDDDGDDGDDNGDDVMDTSLSMDTTVTPKNTKTHRCSIASTPGSTKKDDPIRMTNSTQLLPIMEARVEDVADLFQLSHATAHILLRHFRWSKERLSESLMNNPNKVVEDVGVLERYKRDLNTVENNGGSGGSACDGVAATTACKQQKASTTTGVMTRRQQMERKRTCEICFEEDFDKSDMLKMPCNHEFCKDCWKGFASTMMKDGPTCIRQTCPEADCKEIVTEEEMEQVLPQALSKYKSFQLRSFVELSGTSRWCPGPGCERVATLANAASSSSFFTDATSIIATCDDCTTCFCLKCGEEPHAPLTCKDLSKWHEKCRNESETANWILANTKPCPKCSSRIEKNQGCNHMTCQQCRYEFCWICTGSWADHGAGTGGYYRCNKFESTEDGSEEDQSEVAKAKRELDRYLHYYKRYHAHAEAQTFAKKQLKETEDRMVQLQESTDRATWNDVEFLKNANEQLVECRRVLKYTYCFAFYIPDRAAGRKDKKKVDMEKEQFEYHQEMLERFTEDLSELVEKPLPEINRERVVNQTRVVKTFMGNILQYIDDGME